ncbi:retrotransposon-related protein [Trifolium pratense]|uniref:Retrotransposon-related protein n=1 Tax=Trifolium pratense TaxID=57577 RepID=A0A2K3MZA2_TRIPR|nr:retrotransposon-related protein [Trifolium pratense]
MSARKVTPAAFSKMEGRVESLESEISVVRTTLADVQNAVKENHASLLAMLEKCLGKTTQEDEGSASLSVKAPKAKVELPAFDGEDPAGWISRAEVYFKVQDTDPEVRVNLAQLCTERSTIHFFNSLIGEEDELTWDRLKEALLERYGGHGDGDVYEQLTELKQDGTLEEYITEFEYLTAQIPKLPDKQFLGYFLYGLKGEIKGKVRILAALGDLNRTKLLQVTRAVEREVKGGSGSNFQRWPRSGFGPNRSNSFGRGKSSNFDWVFVKGKEAGGSRGPSIGTRNENQAQHEKKRNGPRDRGFTHLPYQGLMDRRKALCFKCGGAFHPMHQYPDSRSRGSRRGGRRRGEYIGVESHSHSTRKSPNSEVSRLIRGVPVLVLVDSGATHNFISQKLVYKMEWPVLETP